MGELIFTVFEYVLTGLIAASVVAATISFVHMLQLESYQGKMYLKWLFKHFSKELVPPFFAGFAPFIIKCAYVLMGSRNALIGKICYFGADVIYIALLAVFYFSYEKKPKVKPIVYTGRVKRLLVAEFVVGFIFAAGFFLPSRLQYGIDLWLNFILPFGLRYLPGMLLPLFVLLCYLITYPIEEGVKNWYLNDAKRMLKEQSDLIKIGITGSYGKTGAKYALDVILGEKYKTLITPGSFNTPMGVTRTVREHLEDGHQVFIAEMGARYVGDIKTLCKLVRPEYGIITAVGKQHLETFKSLENIISTKGELVGGIKQGGCCFLNGDDENCRAIKQLYPDKQLYFYGAEGEDLYMRAENIQVTTAGSTFELVAEDGKSVLCKTALLGRHNILNLTGAAALAYKLGMSLDEIALGIEKAKPVEHRLQLIQGEVTVIDDAFNSNPVGSKEALRVLGLYKDKRRVVVTPGMVELGEEEARLNKELGRAIGQNADIAIIIGKRHADPICEGILETGFDNSCLIRVSSLKEATEKLPAYAGSGSVVLFENDLPDNYNE